MQNISDEMKEFDKKIKPLMPLSGDSDSYLLKTFILKNFVAKSTLRKFIEGYDFGELKSLTKYGVGAIAILDDLKKLLEEPS